METHRLTFDLLSRRDVRSAVSRRQIHASVTPIQSHRCARVTQSRRYYCAIRDALVLQESCEIMGSSRVLRFD